MRKVVSNTTPLIALADIGHALLADGLYISDAVRDYVLEAAGEGKKISAKDEEKKIK